MSIIQFWRILCARWILIAATTIFCLIGGAIVIKLAPPRWDAEAHVFLNLLKPDPVTGEMIGGPSSRAYVGTQLGLITDYTVVGQAVDRLGWLSDPTLIQQYQSRSQSDTRDFRRWLAQIIIDRTRVTIMDNSNILNIIYTGSDPESAKSVANALMQSYLDNSLSFRRSEAIKSADWYALQAKKAKASLVDAQTAETAFERENNVVMMQDDRTDVDSARLTAMAAQSISVDAGGGGPDTQLAEIDSQIKNLSETLGPNHPDLIALKAKRNALLSIAQQGVARGSQASSHGSRVDQQKALIIAERDKLSKLRNLNSEVELQRDLYNKTAQKEIDFRQQAAVADTGLTPLGSASAPQAPSYPKIPLIVGGALGLGLALGLLVALLTELLNRRVRGAEDLQSLLGVPLLTVLEAAH
jgi:succinoglycan biosynthesis transport protein ExoP